MGIVSCVLEICDFMKRLHLWLLLLLSALLAGCDDDKSPSISWGGDETDNFIGPTRKFSIEKGTEGLISTDVICKLLTPDGHVISRHGSHSRKGGVSNFVLDNGLADGMFRLLSVEYPIKDNKDLADMPEKYKTAQYGMGCRISVMNRAISVCDDFDEGISLYGSGTKEDPYIVGCYSNLISLLKYVNSEESNKNITSETYFKQTNPIDLEQASMECDVRYGWLPIGADTNTPFRGVYMGDEISNLWINRPNTAGSGLFGYVCDATIDSVMVTHADISGNFAVGAIAGAVLTGGDFRGKSLFTNCRVSNSTIAGSPQSFAVGGVVGATDMNTNTLFESCTSDSNTIRGSYNVGGIVGGGGRYSNLTIGECSNSSLITSEYSGAGGIVGAADTINVCGCKNSALINGAINYYQEDSGNSGIGAGGIVGGCGISWISMCTNEGEVNGKYGVGGIVGSTRIKGSTSEAFMYNNTYVRWSQNSGKVSGMLGVGGICGEAQFGCYGVYNSGDISGGDYTAGIVGTTSIAVAHNAVNTGDVTGGSYTSGIVGKTTWGSVALDHNYGTITGRGSHTAGIIGLAGNSTIVHYCGNMGNICGLGGGPSAGIVAEIGDPREWTVMNIAECVIGSVEIVAALAGPIIAVVSGIIEESSKFASVCLEASEVWVHGLLLRLDTALAIYGLVEILSPEKNEALKASLTEVSEEIGEEVKVKMQISRSSSDSFEINDFDKTPISVDYNRNVEETLDYYETEGNDEIFNANINKQREERMEELEHINHKKEIVHEVIAGVSIAVSFVTDIASIVATGGAAAVFVAAGTAVSIVGGVNAIYKSATDFAENVVVISQCVNSGIVTGGDKFGGIVGILQDNSIVSDCLNTAEISKPFVGEAKSESKITNCLSVCRAGYENFVHKSHVADLVYYYPGNLSDTQMQKTYYYNGVMYLTANEINNVASYNRSGMYSQYYWNFNWDLGSDKYWNVSNSTKGFPVPCFSQMRNK